MAIANDITTFVCLFHDPARGRAAISALEEAGIPGQSLSTLGGDSSGNNSYSAGSLAELGVPDRDVRHLEDGLRKGGVLISLQAPESQTDTIEGIFHRYSADKIDETELNAAPVAAAAPLAATGASTESLEGAVIPVAEESLVVGKRQVERGGVRVFRRVVEQPVNESVNLREEHVLLERRPVNRETTSADLQAADREIELVETAEVPVVAKVARVVEEVHVGKVETERTETVQDSVRHTEVELEPVEDTTRPVR